MTKFCAISDTHGLLPEIEPCDVLLIAGDISPLNIQFNIPAMKSWLLTNFIHWINDLPVDKVVLVAGNHDRIFESMSEGFFMELRMKSSNKIIYLKNETYHHFTDEGDIISIFGTSYCHIFGNWSFMRDDQYMEEKFKEIPENIDIIISHDPPYGIGNHDVSLWKPRGGNIVDHLGNYPLKQRLEQINFKWLVCGHIHTGDHDPSEFMNGKVVNVSMLDESYNVAFDPFYFEL